MTNMSKLAEVFGVKALDYISLIIDDLKEIIGNA